MAVSDSTNTSDGNGGSSCASASNTAVSASINTNSNSGSTAISGSNASDSAGEAVAALFEACAAKIAPKEPSAPKWAFERAPAHQPHRPYKGTPRPTKLLWELIRARMDQMSTKNELHRYIIEPKQTWAPKWAIEQALPLEAAQTPFQHFTMPVAPYF
ncbi:hypothetical protein IWW56_001821 [Coemansia sp. RSA 2131]|nr:hypothetical protein IWW56_001821 [Coemansia sp. RSA 2131]